MMLMVKLMIGINKFAVLFVIIGFLALSFSYTPIAAADWPVFQQNLDHTGFIVQPSNFIPNVWNFNAQSPITSSAAILNQTIYFGSNNWDIYAVNLVDGTKIWEYKTGGKIDSSPSIVNNTLYLGSMDDYLYL